MTPPETVRPFRGRLLKILGAVAAAIILIFLCGQMWRDWGTVRAYPWTLRPGWFVASMLALQLAFLVMARSWRSVLRAIGVRWQFMRAFWIFYLSNLGRYIPGNVWQMGAAAVMGRSLGVSGSDIVASMIVHLLYFLPLGITMALASGAFPPPFEGVTFQVLAWLGALVCVAAALWPHMILRAVPRLAALLKLDPNRWKMDVSRRLAIAGQTVAAWIFLSSGFAFMVFAVAPVDLRWGLDLARTYIVAHTVGYLVLVAPAGLGVREGVMVVLLTPIVGAGPAAGMALLARLWFTVAEVLTVGLAVYWFRLDRSQASGPGPTLQDQPIPKAQL